LVSLTVTLNHSESRSEFLKTIPCHVSDDFPSFDSLPFIKIGFSTVPLNIKPPEANLYNHIKTSKKSRENLFMLISLLL
jgi:hypothetical protein